MSETFGQVIRKARREEEYSQRELAKLIPLEIILFATPLRQSSAHYSSRASQSYI